MPIVNGVYVNDSLPDAKQAQEQVFGSYSKKDMNDYSTAAYNYLMKQQEQAYNLELWNLQNQYNSPAAQMQRYQDAGLNPNLIYSQQNTAQSPASASAAAFRPNNYSTKSFQAKVNAGLGIVQQLISGLKAGRDVYDYVKYGAEKSRWDMINSQETVFGLKFANEWKDWLLHGDNMIYGDTTRSPGQGPQGRQYLSKTDQLLAGTDRLRKLIGLIDDQKARERALKDLDEYRLKVLQGQNDAILSIDTGYKGLDSFLRILAYFLQNNAGSWF